MEIQRLTMLMVAAGLSVATLSVSAAVSAETSAKASATAVPAKSRVQGTVPAGKTAIASTSSTRSKRATVERKPLRPSEGQLAGLNRSEDPLELKSSVALVVNQDTDEVLFEKNTHAVLPIASITKLMTALVVTEAELPLDEVLTVTQADVDVEKHSPSRLRVGTRLTRGEMMHLALMSSENRAAHALGRGYPGGLPAFVKAMNSKAQELGMTGTRYVDPTGLSSGNQSNARDLAVLVEAAYQYDLIRTLSTSPEHYVAVGPRELRYRNSNRLVTSPQWSIGLQKTGYIAEAAGCLVMQAELAGRKFIMVLLDSAGHYSRIADAERLRHWLTGDANPATFVSPVS